MRSISLCTMLSTIGGRFLSSHSLSIGFKSVSVISSSVRAPLPMKLVVIGGTAARRSISTVLASEDSDAPAALAAGSDTNDSADDGGGGDGDGGAGEDG